MLEECVFAGFGGQGILMLGKLLAQAAMDQEMYASWLPSYGPEMRGGTCNCTVAFSDDEIGSPVAATYDVVIAMNQPSLEKFEPMVKPGGTLLVNSSIVPVKASRSDVEVHYVACDDIADEVAGSNRSANVVALGALHAIRNRLKTESFESAIRECFHSKGDKVIQPNLKAFRAGVEAAAQPAKA